MDKLERLFQRCELLKMRIKDLQALDVEDHQRSIKEIQLIILKENLSEVGRQIVRITLYKRDEND